MQLVGSDLDFLRSCEGIAKGSYRDGKYYAYKDTNGTWTNYYGCTYDTNTKRVTKDTVWDEVYAEECFKFACSSAVKTVNELMKRDNVTLTQNQFGALVSFAYNVGNEAFKQSTLWKRIVAKDTDERISDAFMMWIKETVNGQKVVNKGLYNRRQKEVDYFMRGA